MVNRFQPAGPVQAYKTYSIKQPKTGHTRIASCEQAGCEANEHGWKTVVPMLSPQADYIRNHSGRRFREDAIDGVSTFTFYPGQQCFGEHHVVDRPQFYLVRGGDWRANTGHIRTHTRGEFWVEDMQETFDGLRTAQEKG